MNQWPMQGSMTTAFRLRACLGEARSLPVRPSVTTIASAVVAAWRATYGTTAQRISDVVADLEAGRAPDLERAVSAAVRGRVNVKTLGTLARECQAAGLVRRTTASGERRWGV